MTQQDYNEKKAAFFSLQRSYYLLSDTGSPVSDIAYDMLKSEIELYEKENGIKSDPSVGYEDPKADVDHEVPMLSIKDVFSIDGAKAFITRNFPGTAVVAELKCDGASLEVLYANGKLKQAATRGTGLKGRNVTAIARATESIPKFIAVDSLRVRGELVIPFASFLNKNAQRMSSGLKVFANPRNLASGTLGLDDLAEVTSRGALFIPFEIIGSNLGHVDQMKFLESLGFHGGIRVKLDSLANLDSFVQEVTANRSSYPYQIDGIVIKADSISARKKAGAATTHPKWAVALKLPAETAETTVKEVIFQVGKSGAVTPVALLDPIELAGTTVSRVSLHNMGYVHSKGIGIGSLVTLHKAGDIIPEILMTVTPGKDVDQPTKCPSCGYPLTDMVCFEKTCPDKVKELLVHAFSKKALDLDGLGDKTAEAMVAAGITSVYDVFSLLKDDSRMVNAGITGKTMSNLIDSLGAIKHIGLDRLIYALAIPGIGGVSSRKIADAVGKVITESMLLKDIVRSDVVLLQGVDMSATSKVFLALKESKLLELFEELGVKIYTGDKKGMFSGVKFAFTGTMSVPRSSLEKEVQDRGGTVSSTISKNMVLVSNSTTTTKARKAQEIGVKVITEDEFLKWITESE